MLKNIGNVLNWLKGGGGQLDPKNLYLKKIVDLSVEGKKWFLSWR